MSYLSKIKLQVMHSIPPSRYPIVAANTFFPGLYHICLRFFYFSITVTTFPLRQYSVRTGNEMWSRGNDIWHTKKSLWPSDTRRILSCDRSGYRVSVCNATDLSDEECINFLPRCWFCPRLRCHCRWIIIFKLSLSSSEVTTTSSLSASSSTVAGF